MKILVYFFQSRFFSCQFGNEVFLNLFVRKCRFKICRSFSFRVLRSRLVCFGFMFQFGLGCGFFFCCAFVWFRTGLFFYGEVVYLVGFRFFRAGLGFFWDMLYSNSIFGFGVMFFLQDGGLEELDFVLWDLVFRWVREYVRRSKMFFVFF